MWKQIGVTQQKLKEFSKQVVQQTERLAVGQMVRVPGGHTADPAKNEKPDVKPSTWYLVGCSGPGKVRPLKGGTNGPGLVQLFSKRLWETI